MVVLSEIQHVKNAVRHAEKILKALAARHAPGLHDLRVAASIGISIFPEDGQDSETLIKRADTAMYHAKEKGRNNYQFFDPNTNVMRVRELIALQSLEA